MKFSAFPSVKSNKGNVCDAQLFWTMAENVHVRSMCEKIAKEEDPDKRGELKKNLPIITWQAYFEGRRAAKNAQPSGLFMLDIDHMVGDPYEFYKSKVANRISELGIMVVHKTPSTHGLRIVAKCLPTLSTLEECQKWLASNLKVEYDDVCKDFARSSFMVPDNYIYYINGHVFTDEPEAGTVYAGGTNPVQVNADFEKALENTKADEVDQREGLFGGQDEFHGIPLAKIANEWLETTGGVPTEGERNQRLYKLALRMRYITDFNAATMLRVMPNCGLPQDEMKQLIMSALSSTRAADMPRDLQRIIARLENMAALTDDDSDEAIDFDINKMPPLPPIIRETVAITPDDFKQAVIMCQLPILGALGSKLRAQYLDGQMHSPTFIVALEAPQASGKSFMRRLVEIELAQMIEHDDIERQKEADYDAKVREMKLLNVKITPENKQEILGSRPETIIRFVPATMSVTKLLMRMKNAQGLHLFAMAEEIDTVTKTFKRGFSSYSDLLRVAFDNGIHGQDYASENSFSGVVRLYYNMLASGTPKAMRRFFPDVEDGLVSRVAFVVLPDQFGKPMPLWAEMSQKDKAKLDVALVRLNEVTLQEDTVQPDHVMKMQWLNNAMEQWTRSQQAKAVKENDRTRDIFCRRAAVIGFRAGMLAYFLYGEKRTPTIIRNVVQFSQWIAGCVLAQHILRFNMNHANSNVNPWSDVFERLPQRFTRDELQQELNHCGVETRIREIIYKWRLQGIIKAVEIEPAGGNYKRDTATAFEKVV